MIPLQYKYNKIYMFRQQDKPTIFFTLRASEHKWDDLLR